MQVGAVMRGTGDGRASARLSSLRRTRRRSLSRPMLDFVSHRRICLLWVIDQGNNANLLECARLGRTSLLKWQEDHHISEHQTALLPPC